MPSARRPSPGPGPIGLAAADGLPWVRIVTGVVALGISLALGVPAGWRGMGGDAVATIRPVARSVIAGEPLPPLAPDVPDAAPPARASSVPPPAGARPPVQKVAAWQARPVQRRATAVAKVTVARAAVRRVAHRPPAKAYAPGVREVAQRPSRRRIDVRNEFLAARDQVAALTREDSGSMWLARTAARGRTARAPRRHQLAAHAGARGSLRS